MNLLVTSLATLLGLFTARAALHTEKQAGTNSPGLAAERYLAISACVGARCEAPRETPWLDLGPDLRRAGEAPERDLGNGDVTDVLLPQIKIFYPRDWRPGDERAALCVFPGGGYGMEALRKEGTDIARWAGELGMVGVALKYRVGGNPSLGLFPGPLLDARRCIRLVRQRAHALGTDPARVGIIGFSAGGHLGGMAATLWNRSFPEEEKDALRSTSCRPDFALLIYPVISMNPAITHRETRSRILGPRPSPEMERLCSCERQITPETPPLFTVQSRDDTVSHVNSGVLEQACRAQGVPVRRLLYERGGHGYGREKRGNPTDMWPSEAEKWLRERAILPSAAATSSSQGM